MSDRTIHTRLSLSQYHSLSLMSSYYELSDTQMVKMCIRIHVSIVRILNNSSRIVHRPKGETIFLGLINGKEMQLQTNCSRTVYLKSSEELKTQLSTLQSYYTESRSRVIRRSVEVARKLFDVRQNDGETLIYPSRIPLIILI
jgi:hypothetical protein